MPAILALRRLGQEEVSLGCYIVRLSQEQNKTFTSGGEGQQASRGVVSLSINSVIYR